MTTPGVLNLLLLASSLSPAAELRLELEAEPLAISAKKGRIESAAHELGFSIHTETRYRVLPDGRIELYCAQAARPTLQGAVRERRLTKQHAEER